MVVEIMSAFGVLNSLLMEKPTAEIFFLEGVMK